MTEHKLASGFMAKRDGGTNPNPIFWLVSFYMSTPYVCGTKLLKMVFVLKHLSNLGAS